MIAGSNLKTPRTTVRRRTSRGKYDRPTVDAILDEGLIGHVAIEVDRQPYAMPMLYARCDEVLYLHGAPLSRLLKGLAEGIPMCLTVTLVDGLVLARSAFHSSVNYRSAMVIGRARAVRDRDEKLAALETLVEHMAPGRTREARGPSPQELRATEVIELPIEEASAKIRTGGPIDAARDYALPIWAGELPLGLTVGEPVTDERCTVPVSESARAWGEGRIRAPTPD
jgi:nitroimidazol reductase NimA-like FMN-containing flavoprotein (pyridoxamine 5'-phosphate oxidase superfamily)